MRRWLIEKLGGYPDVDSALESITDAGEKTKILTLAVKRLFNTIGSEDILKLNKNSEWMFKGKVLSQGRKDLLIAEAKALLGTDLWKVLQQDTMYHANKKMFVSSKSESDIIFGKMWLYTLDAFATRLSSLSESSAVYNSKQER